MNEYMVAYRHYHWGRIQTRVSAGNGAQAIVRAQENATTYGGNVDFASFRVVASKPIDGAHWKRVA